MTPRSGISRSSSDPCDPSSGIVPTYESRNATATIDRSTRARRVRRIVLRVATGMFRFRMLSVGGAGTDDASEPAGHGVAAGDHRDAERIAAGDARALAGDAQCLAIGHLCLGDDDQPVARARQK